MSKKKNWDKPIIGGFPIGLYMQPVGANRATRRKSRESQSDPMPPSSMKPAVKRMKTKQVPSSSTVNIHEMKYIEVPTGEVEYVAKF